MNIMLFMSEFLLIFFFVKIEKLNEWNMFIFMFSISLVEFLFGYCFSKDTQQNIENVFL